MRGATRLGLAAYGLAALVILLDQVSKHWILEVFRLPFKASAAAISPISHG